MSFLQLSCKAFANKAYTNAFHIQSTRHFSANTNGDTCDIAIIGSGIMGLNTAYQIARRSPQTRIKVFEKCSGPGYGSSGASSAICRNYYTFEDMIKVAQNGMYHYQNWSDYLQYKDVSGTYTKTGLLIMSSMNKNEVTEQYEKYKKLNIETSIIDKDIMKQRFPQINSDCGVFDNEGNIEWIEKEMDNSTYFFCEEEAGYLEPVQALNDLQTVLRNNYKNNVDLYYNTLVDKIVHSNSKVTGIQIKNKDETKQINCKYVINCCGPFYNKIVEALGGLDIKLKVQPVRMQIVYKDAPNIYSEQFLNDYNCYKYGNNGVPIPIIMDAFSGCYLRPQKQSKQLLLGTIKEDEERDIFDPDIELPTGADPEVRNKYLNSMYHRLEPIVNDIGMSNIVKSLSGFYTVCLDDVHYLIGETKLKGFIVCNGFSGHGFKCAPPIGSMIAQYLTNIKIDGDTDINIDFYSPYRKPYKMRQKSVLA
eukprot:284342_1